MTEDEAVALAEARNRMPGAGRWFAQRVTDGSWRVVRVLADGVALPASAYDAPRPLAPPPHPVGRPD